MQKLHWILKGHAKLKNFHRSLNPKRKLKKVTNIILLAFSGVAAEAQGGGGPSMAVLLNIITVI